MSRKSDNAALDHTVNDPWAELDPSKTKEIKAVQKAAMAVTSEFQVSETLEVAKVPFQVRANVVHHPYVVDPAERDTDTEQLGAIHTADIDDIDDIDDIEDFEDFEEAESETWTGDER